MMFFDLPEATLVDKVIPKNTFHAMMKGKVKKQLTDIVRKITWKHKLSPETINLPGGSLEEIQIFELKLKSKKYIREVTDVIDKNIPYAIIFVITFDDECYFSTSFKHNNPQNSDTAVIDCVLHSEWVPNNRNHYKLTLSNSLDDVLKSFCLELMSVKSSNHDLSTEQLIDFANEKSVLEKEISALENKIKSCKQFNQKVELNGIKNKKVERLKCLINEVGTYNLRETI